MNDEKLAQEFQQRYLDGERGAMAGLYAQCRHIATKMAKAYVARFGLLVTDERMDDAVALALSRCLSRYRTAGYTVRSFHRTLHLEILHELSNHKGPKAAFLKNLVPLESIADPASPAEKESDPDRRRYFDDVYSEPRGPEVIVRIARQRTFRAAVLEIDGMVGRKWIYDHGRELYWIWRMTRGKRANHAEPRRRHQGRNAPSDCGDQSVPRQGKPVEPVARGEQDASALEQDR